MSVPIDDITPEDVMEDFQGKTSISLQEILSNLIDGEENLDLKTDIENPLNLARLYLYSVILEKYEMKKSSELIETFINKFLRYRVSNKRKSREEIIKAISGMLDRMQTRISLSERLTTNLKEK